MRDEVASGPIVIIGRLGIAHADLDEFMTSLPGLIEHAVGEPGCVHYAFGRDLVDPTVFHISEEWATQSALDEHVRSAGYREWAAALRGMDVRERSVTIYSVAERTTR
jgi:quinol monooxygenase YgiN